MTASTSPGQSFRELVARPDILQIVGTVTAYAALQATQQGFQALYVSGAGVANISLGLPDLGISTCADVVTDVSRITAVTECPVLVDIDTGWGSTFNIARSVRDIEKAGAAACHIEDQVQAKRCGHRPNKQIVSLSDMVDRIKSACDGRQNSDFVIMARTDAFAQEGLDGLLERAQACVDAGADMLFPEAIPDLATYRTISENINIPLLANITEFGKTPLFTIQELQESGVAMALYPLSASRAMCLAAESVYATLKQEGTQKNSVAQMQTRDALYQTLNYHAYEQQLDALQQTEKS